MQIDLFEIKRNSDSTTIDAAAREALKRALKEERGEEPVSKIRASTVSKRHSTGTAGIRLALRKFSGFGEITHRALKSTTFDSSELVEKYDELLETYEARKERHEKQQERKQEKKEKAEAIFEQMKKVAKDHEDLEAKFGSIREHRFGSEEVRLRANSDHRGVNLDLDGLSVDQFEQILDILS